MECIVGRGERTLNITRIECIDKLWEKTIDYAKKCSWDGVGEHLAAIMEKNIFSDWEAVFVVENDNNIIGFCTFMKEDYYPENRYFPWISTIFVDEQYRGNRISEKMIDKVVEYAKEKEFSKVYIPSEIKGLYEKYGFVEIDSLVNYAGDIDNIFMKEI